MMKFIIVALAVFAVAQADKDLKAEEAVYLNYGYPYAGALPYAYNYYNGLNLIPSVRYETPLAAAPLAAAPIIAAPAATTYLRYATPVSVPSRVLGTDTLGRTVDVEGRQILLAKK